MGKGHVVEGESLEVQREDTDGVGLIGREGRVNMREE